MNGAAHKEREHFFGAARVVGGLTILSRLAGMVRAMAIASLGAVRATDAFSFAFRIPNLFRRLFGEGALAAAFVPVFTETSETEGPERAEKLLSSALGLLGAFLVVLLVLLLGGLLAWGTFWGGRADRQLLLGLTATMLPFMVTVCVLALCSAALNCRGHFAYPAAAPILLNVVVIAAAWLVAPALRGDLPGRLYIIAASVTVAGLIQAGGVLVLLRRRGFSVRPRLWPIDPRIGAILRTMAPMVVGLGLLQLMELLETAVAFGLTATGAAPEIHLFGRTVQKPLAEGVLVRIDAARYLYQFPLGVLANSLAVAVFPLLSRYGARGDLRNLRDSLNRAVRLAFAEGLATGVGLFLLAEPIMLLIYQRGDFTPEDARQAAGLLRMYVLGMWAYCTHQILVRAFYSVKDAVTPLKVSCVVMVLELVMIGGLIWILGARAFGVATSTVFALNSIILAILLRRRFGRLGGRRFAACAVRSVLASGVMAGVVLLLMRRLAARASWIVVGASVPAGAAAFILVLLVLRAPELGELVRSWKTPAGDEPQPPAA